MLSRDSNPEIEIKEAGDQLIELKVTDAAGATGTAVVAIVAGNTKPEVTLEAPANGDFFTPGKPVAWRATVKDAEEGTSAENPDIFSPRLLISAAVSRGGAESAALTDHRAGSGLAG